VAGRGDQAHDHRKSTIFPVSDADTVFTPAKFGLESNDRAFLGAAYLINTPINAPIAQENNA
jgi:hypothetical protein